MSTEAQTSQTPSPEEKSENGVSRRKFMKAAGLAVGSFYFFPRHVLGGVGFTAPSDKLNIAGVGVGGRGASVLRNMATQNIVALCDVDFGFAAKTFKEYPNAKTFKDYREMLDKMHRDIDAVVVATPEHAHAIIAMEALKRKKHLYVEKPLTYTVQEARVLTEAARKAGVITQMGNQGHSTAEGMQVVEIIRNGDIGKVSTVHAWTNRPIWPQGMPRTTQTFGIPSTLDWELFIGPAALRPYNPAYHPFKWRGWADYGVGALGDMGAHLLDHPNWALELGAPVSVQASCTPWGGTKADPMVSFPLSSQVIFEFAGNANRGPVQLIWNDGGITPARPEEMADDEPMGDRGGGVLYIGDKGKLMHNTYGVKPRLLPASRMQSYTMPTPTIPRIETTHEMDWVNCCKDGKRQPSSNFDYSGPLTETMLLGVIATRFPGKKLLWDAKAMKFTNLPEANEFLSRQYRPGWELS